MSERTYPLKEVLRITGLTHRAVRYYVHLRLLPGAKPRGVATAYTHEQVLRLHVIRLMRTRDRLRLTAIRQRLGRMSVAELEAMLAAARPPAPVAPPPSPAPPPPPEPIAIARPPEPPASTFGT